MLVHTLVTSIGTSPEPSILLVLHSIDEIFANLLGGRSGVSVLAENHLAKFLFIPIIHGILLLRLLLFLFIIAGIGVEILLGSLALSVQVVAELALATLFAVALLVENTDDGLGVDTERNLLHLDGLEELHGLLLGVLSGLLVGFTASLFGFFSFRIGCLAVGVLSLHLGDLPLGLGTFFLYGGFAC